MRKTTAEMITRNKRIIERRFTTNDSLRKIADDEGLSYERIRQICLSYSSKIMASEGKLIPFVRKVDSTLDRERQS